MSLVVHEWTSVHGSEPIDYRIRLMDDNTYSYETRRATIWHRILRVSPTRPDARGDLVLEILRLLRACS